MVPWYTRWLVSSDHADVFPVLPGTDIQCIGHFRLLFSLLRLETCPKMQEMALTVLANVTGSSECIDDIAANQVKSCCRCCSTQGP